MRALPGTMLMTVPVLNCPCQVDAQLTKTTPHTFSCNGHDVLAPCLRWPKAATSRYRHCKPPNQPYCILCSTCDGHTPPTLPIANQLLSASDHATRLPDCLEHLVIDLICSSE